MERDLKGAGTQGSERAKVRACDGCLSGRAGIRLSGGRRGEKALEDILLEKWLEGQVAGK